MEAGEREENRPDPVWYVLHVKPRTEKKAFAYLEFYRCWRHLPLWTKITRVQRRKVRVEKVLFPGYVFARLRPDQRLKIARTNLVVNFIKIKHPRQTIHQLRQIRAAGRLGPIEPAEYFVGNDCVRIKSGPFYGLTGHVREVTGKGRLLVIDLDILGQAVGVKIGAAECEKLPR